jgi:heme-degrading monooxygenase HmoA
MGRIFSSGNWTVKPGHEDQFIEVFKSSNPATTTQISGAPTPRLLRDLDRPEHYISFAEWPSEEALQEWRSRPELPQLLASFREHLDEMAILTLEEVPLEYG